MTRQSSQSTTPLFRLDSWILRVPPSRRKLWSENPIRATIAKPFSYTCLLVTAAKLPLITITIFCRSNS